jgi:thioredoxin reductase/NAD-dependent dihydropyrimidine dehydrogenase PreA subunit
MLEGERTRTTTRAKPTSDVSRVRPLLIAGLVAAAAVAIALFAVPSGSLAAPGPLGRPHRLARVACTGCHGDRADAPAGGQGCIACHGAHPSTRPAHRALQARGALACPSCHTAHGGAEGVTFVAGGGAVRWKGAGETPVDAEGPAGATVPLVPLAACARCHDGARADDPIHACIAGGGARGVDACLDEHQTVLAPLAAGGKCAHQHGAARFVAWEAARAAIAQTDAPPPPPARAPWLWVGSGLGAGALAFAGTALAQRRRRRRADVAGAPAPVAPARVRLPQVDAARCLGCHACVDACPFDVLAVEKHVAVVARPDECCGVGACEQACPNGSLRLAEEGVPLPDRPRVDEHLESLDRPGVFLAGDLTGVPLIRNAIAQGVRAVDRVAATLPKAGRVRGGEGGVDLVIVGAGPAGLSAALRAQELGLSCVVLEQSTLAATIRSFPRGKIVHDPPIELPLEGALWLRESTKEELLAHWTRIVRSHRVDVRERHRVTGVSGERGAFVVSAEGAGGARELRAARVLLAIGRRGTPRTLDAEVASGAAARVLHALSDARALAGRRVLVVGLGDSAMEAVVALARQPGTTVTVSYRGPGFTRGRARNVDEVRRLAAAGRVRIAFESVVTRVDERGAVLRPVTGAGPEERVPADVVLALIGGEPSRGLLQAAGVSCEEPEIVGGPRP